MQPTATPVVVEKPEPVPAAPEGLEVVARVAEPTRFFREIVTHLPSALGSSLPPPETLAELALGSQLAELVDLAQPLDLASVRAESTEVFASFALKPDAEARAAERVPTEERRGLLFVKSGEKGGGFMSLSSTCAFVPATRAAATRLVCASSRETFAETARWLAHGAFVEPIDSDARIIIPGSVVRGDKGKPRPFADRTSKLGDEIVEQLTQEVATIQADLRLGASSGELSGALRLSRRSSPIARALVPSTPPSPPSPAFFRLPSDALFAFHTPGATATDLAPLRRVLFDSLESSLVEDGYLPEKVGAIRTHFESIAMTGGPLVVGVGVAGGLDRTEKALAALDAPRTVSAATAEANARAALAPWVMIHVEQKPDVVVMSLKGIVKGADEADRARKPGSASVANAKKDPDGDHLDVRLLALDPSLKLPLGTQALEVVIAPRTKGKRPVRRARIFAVPKGDTTWIGYSEDVAGIASRLRTAIDDTSDAGTLARSREAVELRSKRAAFTALTSIAGIALLTADRRTVDELLSAARAQSRLALLPSHGASVLTVTGSSEVGVPDTGPAKLAASLSGPRALLTDLATLLLR